MLKFSTFTSASAAELFCRGAIITSARVGQLHDVAGKTLSFSNPANYEMTFTAVPGKQGLSFQDMKAQFEAGTIEYLMTATADGFIAFVGNYEQQGVKNIGMDGGTACVVLGLSSEGAGGTYMSTADELDPSRTFVAAYALEGQHVIVWKLPMKTIDSYLLRGPSHEEQTAFYLHLKQAEDSSVTSGPATIPAPGAESQFAVPPEQVLQLMALMVQNELRTMYAYMHYGNSLRDLSHHSIAEEFEAHADEEKAHADWLLQRMAIIGEGSAHVPDIPAPEAYTDANDIIQEMLAIEAKGMELWKQLHAAVGEDPMRFQIEAYMTTEQQHADELAQLVKSMAPPEAAPEGKIAARVGGVVGKIRDKVHHAFNRDDKKIVKETIKGSLAGRAAGNVAGAAAGAAKSPGWKNGKHPVHGDFIERDTRAAGALRGAGIGGELGSAAGAGLSAARAVKSEADRVSKNKRTATGAVAGTVALSGAAAAASKKDDKDGHKKKANAAGELAEVGAHSGGLGRALGGLLGGLGGGAAGHGVGQHVGQAFADSARQQAKAIRGEHGYSDTARTLIEDVTKHTGAKRLAAEGAGAAGGAVLGAGLGGALGDKAETLIRGHLDAKAKANHIRETMRNVGMGVAGTGALVGGAVGAKKLRDHVTEKAAAEKTKGQERAETNLSARHETHRGTRGEQLGDLSGRVAGGLAALRMAGKNKKVDGVSKVLAAGLGQHIGGKAGKFVGKEIDAAREKKADDAFASAQAKRQEALSAGKSKEEANAIFAKHYGSIAQSKTAFEMAEEGGNYLEQERQATMAELQAQTSYIKQQADEATQQAQALSQQLEQAQQQAQQAQADADAKGQQLQMAQQAAMSANDMATNAMGQAVSSSQEALQARQTSSDTSQAIDQIRQKLRDIADQPPMPPPAPGMAPGGMPGAPGAPPAGDPAAPTPPDAGGGTPAEAPPKDDAAPPPADAGKTASISAWVRNLSRV